MRARVRTRVAAAVVAIAAGGVLALLAPAGPAVAFISGSLFLDVQAESPATLIARGAAVDVPLEVICTSSDASVAVTVTQRVGSGLAQGTDSVTVGCSHQGERIVVRVEATAGGEAFTQGTAVASASIRGCEPRFCGRETDSEIITI
jgi:hypothetical protein